MTIISVMSYSLNVKHKCEFFLIRHLSEIWNSALYFLKKICQHFSTISSSTSFLQRDIILRRVTAILKFTDVQLFLSLDVFISYYFKNTKHSIYSPVAVNNIGYLSYLLFLFKLSYPCVAFFVSF